MKRSIYLTLTPPETARQKILSTLPTLAIPREEEVETIHAGGRIAARAVYARRSIPHYAAAAMDGVAVQAGETFGASEFSPKLLEIGRTAFWVNTGMPMPEGTNAVIMVEQLEEKQPGVIEIRQAAHPWQHVRPVGEDIVRGDILLLPGEEIQPVHVGVLLNGGIFSVAVKPRPVVAILPTGSELVPPEGTPKPGQVIESNSAMMAAYVTRDGGIPRILPPCADEEQILRQNIQAALKSADVLFVLSGSSAGSKDFTRGVLEGLGTVHIHGIAMMPGKPALYATLFDKPVFGIPGYPTSAALFYEEMVSPFMAAITGKPVPSSETLLAEVIRKIPSKLGQEELIRVRLGKIGDRWIAIPLPRGAGVLHSLSEADGVLRIPEDSEGVSERSPVSVQVRRSKKDIEGTLLFVGSHDLSLDRANELLAQRKTGVTLAIGAIGSLGGVFALKSGRTHLTAIHLLDPETKTYNLPYIRKYLPNRRVRLIHLLTRTQGLMVRKGNPKRITSIRDLYREDVQFVNRQRGAGTRVLLDVLLKEEGISPDAVTGYANEVATHTMVAAEIRGGMADCGMGIEAAARALELDFIPLAKEPYDLVIPEELMDDWRVRELLTVIRSDEFRNMVSALGGYDPSESGNEIPV